jgi:hypothetical protein
MFKDNKTILQAINEAIHSLLQGKNINPCDGTNKNNISSKNNSSMGMGPEIETRVFSLQQLALLVDHYGGLPPTNGIVPAVLLDLPVEEYSLRWSDIISQLQSLLMMMDMSNSNSNSNITGNKHEDQMKELLAHCGIMFLMALYYRQDLVKEVLASARLPNIARLIRKDNYDDDQEEGEVQAATDAQWKKLLLNELELTDNQVLHIKMAWKVYEAEMQQAKRAYAVTIESLPGRGDAGSNGGAGAGAGKEDGAMAVDEHPSMFSTINNNNTTTTTSSMADQAGASIDLRGVLRRLEIWEQRHFLAMLKLWVAGNAVFNNNSRGWKQRAKVLALSAPYFPDLLHVMKVLSSQ